MKSMCQWCQRAPHKPHLANCPAITGGGLRSNPTAKFKKRKSGAYLRRSRNPDPSKWLSGHIYLVETRKPEPDTPAALFWEMYNFPYESNQPPEPRLMPTPNPTKGAR